jgi:rhombotail lipoprotein
MKIWILAGVLSLSIGLAGCAEMNEFFCAPNCHAQSRNSSSLVDFLYPKGQEPPAQNSIPQLHVPLRVGLAFLPSTGFNPAATLDAAQREQLLNRISEKFKGRSFVAQIVVIPDYYLATNRGFSGLEAVQRLYSIDVMALVSYDQIMHEDDNRWSLGYLTIVGAYVLPGTRHDVSTLVDLAVVDPQTRSLILRAGGTDTQHGNSTLIEAGVESRTASAVSFNAATEQMIGHFDVELTRFEQDVKAGKANVQLVNRDGSVRGGGGAMGWFWLMVLLPFAAATVTRRM